MEDNAPINFQQINNNICAECGLPLKIFSYDKIEGDNDSQKIKITLFCQNPDHKKHYECDFEEYQNLIENNLNIICKCVLCNQILQNTSNIAHYCYDCKKIICSDCLEKNHDKNHEKVVKYEELKNKCLIHSDNSNEIKFFCLNCKKGMCNTCITSSLEHVQQHLVKEIYKFKIANENNIKKLKNKQEEYNKERNNLLNQLKMLDYKINFNNLLIKEESKYFYLFKYDNLKQSVINFNFENNQNDNQKNNNINNVQYDEKNNNKMNNINNVQQDEKNNNQMININNAQHNEKGQNQMNNINNVQHDDKNNNQNNNIQDNNINNNQFNENNNNQINNKNDDKSNIHDDDMSKINLQSIVLMKNDGIKNEWEIIQDNNSNSDVSQNNNINHIDNNNYNIDNNNLKNNNLNNNNLNNNINYNNLNNNNLNNNNLNNKDNNINNKLNLEKNNETPMGNKNKDNAINNNQINIVKNEENNKIKNEEVNPINVIYLDDNLKFDSKGIIDDCCKIQKKTKCSLILLNDLNNLTLLFLHLLKNKTKSKFIFIVNGGKSEDSVNFIKKNKEYKSLFIGACIYTTNLEKYSKIKKKYSDFFYDICTNPKNVIEFIKKTAENSKIENQKYYINSIINLFTYKDDYFKLHKEISNFYGDESENVFNFYYKLIETQLSKELNEPKKQHLLSCFQTFKEILKKNYEEIIVCYLKDNYFSEYLNSNLKTKNFDNYQSISYFVGNLMHSLVQYGEKMKKSVDFAMTFFKGMQLSIVDIMEFLKNRQLIIIFEYFLSVSSKKELAEITSKRKMDVKERKEKQFYSVILKIDYAYDNGYKPSIIDLRDLQPYPSDENYIILPFTFLNLKKIEIDSNKYLADIELEVIGKNEILENQIKDNNNNNKVIEYDDKQHIMILK